MPWLVDIEVGGARSRCVSNPPLRIWSPQGAFTTISLYQLLFATLLQSEGPTDDNLIWGNCDLYQTFCTVKKKISDHLYLFFSAKRKKLYGSKYFLHLPARVNRGQSWVVANPAGLVWWKIKMYQSEQLERTNSAAEQWVNSVFIRFFRDFIRFHLQLSFFSWDFCRLWDIPTVLLFLFYVLRQGSHLIFYEWRQKSYGSTWCQRKFPHQTQYRQLNANSFLNICTANCFSRRMFNPRREVILCHRISPAYLIWSQSISVCNAISFRDLNWVDT